MIMQKLWMSIFFVCMMQTVQLKSMIEQFKNKGYVEIYDQKHHAATFDRLYQQFDEFIAYLQANQAWVNKIYAAKERFIRSAERDLYSSDMCGFYDESKKIERSQVSFYYSTHFHACICSLYPEINQIGELTDFLQACYEISKSYESLLSEISGELGLQEIFAATGYSCPLLLKIIKYLPLYVPAKPHYDGTALTLFLDSTYTQALALAPYASSFSIEDFYVPVRKYSRFDDPRSMLLIPGTLVTEFSMYPTPHIVQSSGKVRYATIAFAMRPYYIASKVEFTPLPDFKD